METEINQDKITNKERVSYALKDLITLKNYIFIPLSLYCIYLFFFKIDEVSIGVLISRLIQFIIVFFLGGLLGMKIGESMSEGEFNLKSSSKSFRVGVIIFLFCSTFFHWLNRANENIQYSTSSKCHECGASYSGNGWSTIGGEQYQAKDPRYNLYCSKECAYNSQPNRWK